jgi:hypothetical protein
MYRAATLDGQHLEPWWSGWAEQRPELEYSIDVGLPADGRGVRETEKI